MIPIAGDQITNDIAMALRTPTAEAEAIKTRHGVALRQLADANEMIEVPGIGDRPPRVMSRQTLAEVIEPRAEELFSLVQQVLRESGYEELLSSGIVLTGGSSMMQGMVELGEEIFHMPVRIGMPRYSGGLADVVRRPALRHRHGPAARGRIAAAAGARCQTKRFRRRGIRTDARLVSEEFLMWSNRQGEKNVRNRQ